MSIAWASCVIPMDWKDIKPHAISHPNVFAICPSMHITPIWTHTVAQLRTKRKSRLMTSGCFGLLIVDIGGLLYSAVTRWYGHLPGFQLILVEMSTGVQEGQRRSHTESAGALSSMQASAQINTCVQGAPRQFWILDRFKNHLWSKADDYQVAWMYGYFSRTLADAVWLPHGLSQGLTDVGRLYADITHAEPRQPCIHNITDISFG